MSEHTNNNVTEIVRISEKNTQLALDNQNLQNNINQLKVDNETLRREKQEIEKQVEETRPVKIITRTQEHSRFGGTTSTSNVEYCNLETVKNEIRVDWEKKNKEKLNKIEQLKAELETYKQERLILQEEKDAHTDRETRRFKIKADDLEASFKEKEGKLNKKIKELEEEIQKERDNKTDKELETKRNEEIKTLKKRIKVLEQEINTLSKLNFWGRARHRAKVNAEEKEARKELILEQEAVAEIPTNHTHKMRMWPFSG